MPAPLPQSPFSLVAGFPLSLAVASVLRFAQPILVLMARLALPEFGPGLGFFRTTGRLRHRVGSEGERRDSGGGQRGFHNASGLRGDALR
jgi:hypothetical protein